MSCRGLPVSLSYCDYVGLSRINNARSPMLYTWWRARFSPPSSSVRRCAVAQHKTVTLDVDGETSLAEHDEQRRRRRARGRRATRSVTRDVVAPAARHARSPTATPWCCAGRARSRSPSTGSRARSGPPR